MTIRIFHCNELSMVCTQDLSLISVAMCPTQDLWTSIHQIIKKDESALRDDCHCPDSQVTTPPMKMLFGLSNDVRAPTTDVGYVPNAKYLAHIPHQTPFEDIYQMC